MTSTRERETPDYDSSCEAVTGDGVGLLDGDGGENEKCLDEVAQEEEAAGADAQGVSCLAEDEGAGDEEGETCCYVWEAVA